MKLYDIAHARAGDKGTISNVGVFPYDPVDFAALKGNLTVDVVAQHFGPLVLGPVERFEVRTLPALNYVLHDVRPGGVAASLLLDTHGKSLSFSLLELNIDAWTWP